LNVQNSVDGELQVVISQVDKLTRYDVWWSLAFSMMMDHYGWMDATHLRWDEKREGSMIGLPSA
jgi:hypothetical protein